MELATIELRVSRSENLPVLPEVVSQVIKLADDPSSSARTLEQLVGRDPAMTAKILRAANSPYYGASQVASIGRAVSLLGLNTMKSLVLGIAFQQSVGKGDNKASFDKVEFWRHSLAVAVGARIIGKLTLPLRSEELYCAGMLHDVGLLVLEKFDNEGLQHAASMAKKDGMELARGLPPSGRPFIT